MKTLFDTYRPKNQTDCDCANALREYERLHAICMKTSVFADTAAIVKRNMDIARDTYVRYYQIANPTHTVI